MRLPRQFRERPQLAFATFIYCMMAMVFLTLVLFGKMAILDSAASLITVGLMLIVMARSRK